MVALILLSSIALAQHAIEPQFTYHRAICVVPPLGTGTRKIPNVPSMLLCPMNKTVMVSLGSSCLPTDHAKPASLGCHPNEAESNERIFTLAF